MKRIGLLADTHWHMDERIIHHLAGCDEIWHAGDIGDLSVTDTLSNMAPLRAVYGNIDGAEVRREIPAEQRFKCEDMKVWMLHIAGRPGKYDAYVRENLSRLQPNILVCGHSHICMVKYDKSHNVLYMNPGAAGIRGFHKVRTLLRFTVDGKNINNLEVVELKRDPI